MNDFRREIKEEERERGEERKTQMERVEKGRGN